MTTLQPHEQPQMACPDRFSSPLTRIPTTQTKGHVQHSFTSVKLHWSWARGENCSCNNFTPKIKATVNRPPGYLINGRHHLILIKSQSVNCVYWEAYLLPLVWHMHHMVHFPTGKPAPQTNSSSPGWNTVFTILWHNTAKLLMWSSTGCGESFPSILR